MSESIIFNDESRLLTDEGAYNVRLYDERLDNFDERTAYLNGDYYYLYRGNIEDSNREDLPGIYYDDKKKKYILMEVIDKDNDEYKWEGKIGTINTDKIIEMINNKEVIIINMPESDKMTIPDITENDDILKRIMKTAMRAKHINIDMYKSRFADKNALFNFKQVIKGDGRLSMLLFDRGMDALNLKYKIIVEEADPSTLIIGVPLEDAIISSSDESHPV